MREQQVTVSGLYRPGWRVPGLGSQVPLLLLCGSWLSDAGFHVGSKVRVLAEPGRVVVELRESATSLAGGAEG